MPANEAAHVLQIDIIFFKSSFSSTIGPSSGENGIIHVCPLANHSKATDTPKSHLRIRSNFFYKAWDRACVRKRKNEHSECLQNKCTAIHDYFLFSFLFYIFQQIKISMFKIYMDVSLRVFRFDVE